jgi:uncharacterized protein (DUF2384 family)
MSRPDVLEGVPMTTQTDNATLTKAVLRAAERLGLTDSLHEIIGIDAASVERMRKGEIALDPSRAEWESATRFTGLFRSLLTLVDTIENARNWLSTPHQTLGAVPAEMLRTPNGRDHVLRYLDAVQKYEMKLPPRGTLQ